MKKMFLVLVLLIGLTFSCTQNQRAKKYGGTATIELPKETKLIEATWKNDDLWFLYRKRRVDEPIETYVFKEESSFGVIEGKVIFKEQ